MPIQNRASLSVVAVSVISVHGNGIQVKLLDTNQDGFIRQREVTWERRVSVPVPIPRPGDVLNAVFLEQNRSGAALLSLKRLTDPWRDAIEHRRYWLDKVVEGEVVNVRATSAHIQIEPGIDAFLSPASIPRLPNQSMTEVLALGDKISARVRSVDTKNRQIEISLLRRLQEITQFDDHELRKSQLNYFGIDRLPRPDEAVHTDGGQLFTEVSLHPQKISRLRRILIIDNERWYLTALANELHEYYAREGELEVDSAVNAAEAWQFLDDRHANSRSIEDEYQLVLIDIQLDNGENGLTLARAIRKKYPTLPILLMTILWQNEDRQLAQEEFSCCYKNLDEIVQQIEDLRSGAVHRVKDLKESLPGNAEDRFQAAALSGKELRSIAIDILKQLQEEIEADHCLFVELDRENQQAHLFASLPEHDDLNLKIIEDGLYFSPVREVVEDQREILHWEVRLESDDRFKYFFPSLDFRSCLGIPVLIPNEPARYGLFLLDRRSDHFGRSPTAPAVNRARYAALVFGRAIERNRLLDSIRYFEERYVFGQLLSDLMHETNNKITALDSNLEQLRIIFAERSEIAGAEDDLFWQDRMQGVIQRLTHNYDDLRLLVDSYMRQARNDYEAVDANDVVHGVALQLSQKAKRMGTGLYLIRDPNLPKVYALRSALQQIVLNLMLNALQMISDQRHSFAVLATRSLNARPLLQQGLIIVQTRYTPERSAYPVEIRIIDNGPGVHWRDHDDIFRAGVSKRGGAGLGLFISSNLANRMQGRLRLLDSILFLGSAFVVELNPFPE